MVECTIIENHSFVLSRHCQLYRGYSRGRAQRLVGAVAGSMRHTVQCERGRSGRGREGGLVGRWWFCSKKRITPRPGEETAMVNARRVKMCAVCVSTPVRPLWRPPALPRPERLPSKRQQDGEKIVYSIMGESGSESSQECWRACAQFMQMYAGNILNK